MNKIYKKILQEISYKTGKYTCPPEYVNLIITFKCNFKCQTCSIWQKSINWQNELSENDWLKTADQLIKNLPKETFIEINGGEPLLRKKLVLKLIKKLKRHFKTVALNSNGSTITSANIKELEKIGLDTIKISFYSLNKNIHNKIRGTNIAYDKAIQAIEELSNSKIKTEVGILITSKNINQIQELIKYLNQFNNISMILQPLDESVESEDSKSKRNHLNNNLWPKKSQTIKFFDWILNNSKYQSKIKNSILNIKAIKNYYLDPKSTLKYRCLTGQRNLIIYPNGDVAYCFKRPKIGNLKNQKLLSMQKNATIERKSIKKCGKYCRILGCNFSRGIKEIIK